MTPARIVRMKTKARSSRRMSRIDCHHASVVSAERVATAGDVTASSPAKRHGTPAAAWRGWYTAVRSPEGDADVVLGQPLGSTTIVTSGVMPAKTLTATL